MGWIKGSLIGAITFLIICLIIIALAIFGGGFSGLFIAFIGYPWILMGAFSTGGGGTLSSSTSYMFLLIPTLINLAIFTIIGGIIGLIFGRNKQ